MRPEHPIVLITGASSGFGAAMARLLASQGCHLALGARRLERVQALADELVKAHGIKAFARTVDTRDTASVNAFMQPPPRPSAGSTCWWPTRAWLAAPTRCGRRPTRIWRP